MNKVNVMIVSNDLVISSLIFLSHNAKQIFAREVSKISMHFVVSIIRLRHSSLMTRVPWKVAKSSAKQRNERSVRRVIRRLLQEGLIPRVVFCWAPHHKEKLVPVVVKQY